MRYESLRYLPEQDDPSLTIETTNLVVKVIDNTGLLAPPVPPDDKAYFNTTFRYTPFSHHLGYHGIRTFYDKQERRNLVVPFISWLNLQNFELSGIPNDPVDERAAYGIGRGWPIRLERKGKGAVLTLDPLPQTQFRYTLELQPAEPDGIDFSCRFEFQRHPESGPAQLKASWPCYMNGYDDVRLFYPRGKSSTDWQWASLGEKPKIIIGEPVGYQHDQTYYRVDEQAFPLAYGQIGQHALAIMFDDPRVKFFCVNAGGHHFCSAIQNPAWDWSWSVSDYPVNQPIGFNGRLVYTRFESADQILERYAQWRQQTNIVAEA